MDLARAEGRERATGADVDRVYRERILPAKLAMDAAYLRSRSLKGDLVIMGSTLWQLLSR